VICCYQSEVGHFFYGTYLMAYLTPHFEFDVFVSYSHGDPTGTEDSPLRAWSGTLIQKLEGYIKSVATEFRGINIWIDLAIDPTEELTEQLRATVGASGILLIIMTPYYLASNWCGDERDWFRNQIQSRSPDKGRVFIIRALSTDEKPWPDFLLDERGHRPVGFRFYDPQTGMPYGWDNVHSDEFVKRVWTLQTTLRKRLQALRERHEQRTKSQPQARPQTDTPHHRSIFLHSREDQREARDAVMNALLENNIIAMSLSNDTGTAVPEWNRQARERIEIAKRCDALVLLRADPRQNFLAELLDIGVYERRRIEAERRAPLLCAVFDQTATSLPVDIAGIRRFDLAHKDWRHQFETWLLASHGS
jgi:hypothetical protein